LTIFAYQDLTQPKNDTTAIGLLRVNDEEFGSRWISMERSQLGTMVQSFDRHFEICRSMLKKANRGRPADTFWLASHEVLALAPTFADESPILVLPDIVNEQRRLDYRRMIHAAAFLFANGIASIRSHGVIVRANARKSERGVNESRV
jgi:hypothetical protein